MKTWDNGIIRESTLEEEQIATTDNNSSIDPQLAIVTMAQEMSEATSLAKMREAAKAFLEATETH